MKTKRHYTFSFYGNQSYVQWDIRDVWKMMEGQPVTQLPIEPFVRRHEFMWRSYNKHHLERVKQADLSYPILVTRLADADYHMLIDGGHRLFRHYQLGHKTVPVQFVDKMPPPVVQKGSKFNHPYLKLAE